MRIYTVLRTENVEFLRNYHAFAIGSYDSDGSAY